MKSEKGITLTVLIVYIVLLIIVIGVLGNVTSSFNNNTKALQEDTEDFIEFNNFNQYFIKEIKTANNKIDKISADGTYILFKTGNAFHYEGNSIYYNNIEISRNVKEIKFSYDKDQDENIIDNIIVLDIKYNVYSKQMKYKVEEIY